MSPSVAGRTINLDAPMTQELALSTDTRMLDLNRQSQDDALKNNCKKILLSSQGQSFSQIPIQTHELNLRIVDEPKILVSKNAASPPLM